MFTQTFWKSAIERAIRTFCQTLVAVVGASQFDWMSADWQSLLVTSGIAAGLSVLTSVAGVNIGDKGSASVAVVEIPKTVHNPTKPEGL
jgi:ammonia channel protein AmtB